MEYLSWIDILGPVLTTLAAIIALSGDPFNKNGKWYSVLNARGKTIATLIIISVFISICNTKNTNRDNQVKFQTEKERYESLNIKYDSIKGKLEKSIKSKDSLNSVIKKLDKDFVDATFNELKEQRRIFDENKRRILKNLLNETVFNINTYNSWKMIRKTRWINEGNPTVLFQTENLKSALLIPNEDILLTGILIVKKQIDEINIGFENVISSDIGSKERIINVETIFEKIDLLGKNLDALYKALKIVLPDVDVKFNTNDSIKEVW